MADSYGATFLQSSLSLPTPAGWETMRQLAIEKLRTDPLPTSDQEIWKYLDLTPVYSQILTTRPQNNLEGRVAKNVGLDSYSRAAATHYECLAPESVHSRLVFTNGVYDTNLSDTSALSGNIFFSPLTNSHSSIASQLITLATPDISNTFANLNTARFEDGVVLHVPDGQPLDIPLHIVFISHGLEAGNEWPLILPRILVMLGTDSRAHLTEEYRGTGNYLTSSVVEIILGSGSYLRHDRIQRESRNAYHFSTLCTDISESASYVSTSISLGAAICRHDPQFVFSGKNAEVELNGLSMVSATQTADTHSLIDHAVPNCTSRQLHKYIIGAGAHGIFNGQVLVRPGAQQTNASQSSRNLLLSERAKIDTKPQLEIFADDVKCSHAATVGQLNTDELFYLQSRGLDLDSAKNLLIEGFAADTLNRLALPSLRCDLRKHVMD